MNLQKTLPALNHTSKTFFYTTPKSFEYEQNFLYIGKFEFFESFSSFSEISIISDMCLGFSNKISKFLEFSVFIY